MARKKGNDALKELDARVLRSLVRISILKLVKSGHSHGYELMKMCCGQECKKMSSGLLYTTLNDLEGDGYLTSEWRKDTSTAPRKEYALTSTGEKFLREGIRQIKKSMREIIS
jgi:DNA-binding PadR family transcriptional regulator